MGKQLGTWYAEPVAGIISAPEEEHGTKRAGRCHQGALIAHSAYHSIPVALFPVPDCSIFVSS